MSEEIAANTAEIDIIRTDFPVTLTLRGKQRSYGVPENQFTRYAQYCTRRCARIRQILRIKGGKEFELTPLIHQNALHLELLVLMADGCWTYYKELKSSATGGQDAGGSQRTAQSHGEGNRARAQWYEVRTRLSQVYVLGCAHTSACADFRNAVPYFKVKFNNGWP